MNSLCRNGDNRHLYHLGNDCHNGMMTLLSKCLHSLGGDCCHYIVGRPLDFKFGEGPINYRLP